MDDAGVVAWHSAQTRKWVAARRSLLQAIAEDRTSREDSAEAKALAEGTRLAADLVAHVGAAQLCAARLTALIATSGAQEPGVEAASSSSSAAMATASGPESRAPRAQVARTALRRAASLRELVGSDAAMRCLLAFLGSVSTRPARYMRLKQALEYGHVLPGVRVGRLYGAGLFKPGQAELALLASDTGIGGLALRECAKAVCGWLCPVLKRNEGLRQLDLSGVKASGMKGGDTALLVEALAANTTIEELNLEGHALGNADGLGLVRALASNANLRVLGLRHTGLGDVVGCKIIKTLATSLVELDLSRNHLYVKGVRAIATLLLASTTLLKLRVQDNTFQNLVGVGCILKAMVRNETLVELGLGETNFDEPEAAALLSMLRQNRTLRSLDLSKSRSADDSGCDAVLAALKDNVGLQVLTLHQCRLWAEDAAALFEAMLNRPVGSLRELNLDENPILGDRGVCTILEMCAAPGSAMRRLDLSGASLGRSAGTFLGSFLRHNSSLEALKLAGLLKHESHDYHADEDGEEDWAIPTYELVFAGLGVNTGLQELELFKCGLCEDDVKALAAAIEGNRSLTELSVLHDSLSTKSGKFLAKAVASSNSTLRKLNLTGNELNSPAALAFAKAFATNTTLRFLGLSGNNMSERAQEIVTVAGEAVRCSIET